jgi:AcrR family transcriptional regulator
MVPDPTDIADGAGAVSSGLVTVRATEPLSDIDAVYAEIGRHGTDRHASIDGAQRSLEKAIAATRAALERGVPLNMTEVARRAGVSKQTLYNHLPAALVAAARAAAADPDGTPVPPPAGPDPEET